MCPPSPLLCEIARQTGRTVLVCVNLEDVSFGLSNASTAREGERALPKSLPRYILLSGIFPFKGEGTKATLNKARSSGIRRLRSRALGFR